MAPDSSYPNTDTHTTPTTCGSACNCCYVIEFDGTGGSDVETLPDSGYLDSWPKTGDPPPPWRRPAAQAVAPRGHGRRPRSQLSSTTLPRMRESLPPGRS